MDGTNPMNIMKQKKVLPYVICVEGNIGSGKSTLLKNLKQNGFTVIEEPVADIWGQYLPRLYNDLKRWGFCFQMEAMDWFRQLQSRKFAQILATMKAKEHSNSNQKGLDAEIASMSLNSSHIDEADTERKDEDTEDEDDDINSDINSENTGDHANANAMANRRRSLSPNKQLLRSQKKAKENEWKGSANGSEQARKVIIVERSALSCITIFAANLRDSGKMTKWEYSLLQRFYSMIAWEPAHILYIRADPEVCCGRITKRNRDGEGNVDPKLIESLHNKHERTFVSDRRASADFSHGGISASAQNIIVVNGHKDAHAVLKEALFKIGNIESSI